MQDNFKDLYIIEEQYKKILKESKDVREEWATAKSAYDSIHNKKGSYVSFLMSKETGSNAEKKMRAEATDEWTVFLDGLNEANKNYLQAQANKEFYIDRLEFARSLMTNRREEIKNFGG